MTKASTRPYVVDFEGHPTRLVRATYAHMAERHVVGTMVKSRVATKDDLINLLQNNVRLEEAADVEPEVDPRQPPLPGLDNLNTSS